MRLVLVLSAFSSASSARASSLATVAPQWVHPGVLVGPADIAAARARIAKGEEPTTSFFAAAQKTPQGAPSYTPYGPPLNGTISCGYYDKPNIGCGEEDSDVDSAYLQALLFALGGDVSHATKARATINLYSSGLRKYTNNTEGTCCGNEALQASWVGAKITRAAELLRHTRGSGWTSADTAAFVDLMYKVHLPLLLPGTSANGNWMASFLEAMFGIAVFNEDAQLFSHAVKAWEDRMPSYFYVTTDGAVPPTDPQPNCEPQPLCEWYNQTTFSAATNGVAQETCRDMGHFQMGFAAFLNGATTASLNGVDLVASHAARFFAGAELAARLLTNSTPPAPALLCSGAPVKMALMPTFEVAHASFVRLGLDDVHTRAQLATNVRPSADQFGSQVSIWETLSHGLPL